MYKITLDYQFQCTIILIYFWSNNITHWILLLCSLWIQGIYIYICMHIYEPLLFLSLFLCLLKILCASFTVEWNPGHPPRDVEVKQVMAEMTLCVKYNHSSLNNTCLWCYNSLFHRNSHVCLLPFPIGVSVPLDRRITWRFTVSLWAINLSVTGAGLFLLQT